MPYLLENKKISFEEAFPELEPTAFELLVRQGKCGNYSQKEPHQRLGHDRIGHISCENPSCKGDSLALSNELYSFIRRMIELKEVATVKNFCCKGYEIKPTKSDGYGKSCSNMFEITVSLKYK
ncbi:MAG: hypothetical protein WBP46_18505 [Thiolinea sp.]